jgi:glucosyl-dolichyl phosphate glucuronosyltransferase
VDRAPAVDDAVTVVIPAYTDKRWELTCAAVESVLAQTTVPKEVIVCVDHNPALLDRFRERFPKDGTYSTPVRIVESRHEGHVSASRTTGMELAQTPLILFLDDDAAAPAGWLELMTAPLHDPGVVAVGGYPRPIYARERPRWFPYEFDWIFGCAYRGLPTETAPTQRLIGTTMAARREDLVAIDGFHFDAFEDMAMCHQLQHLKPDGILLWEARAVVDHHVHADRLTWAYFWRRCFSVNRAKVAVMKQMGTAGDTSADRRFAFRTLGACTADAVKGLARGDVGGVLRLGGAVAGLGCAAVGFALGLVQWRVRRPTWPSGRRPIGQTAR